MPAEILLRRLADGQCHSGERLARELDLTRAAIWKQVDKLRAWGLEVEALPGRGYRLRHPLDLIDRDALCAALARDGACGRVEVHTELASTNRHLVEGARPTAGRLDVCLAEFQSEGRGRRGRPWRAPLAACLCVSVGYSFAATPPELGALSLAIGATVRTVIAELTKLEPQLKWPNDLVWRDAKLGGILVELAAEAQGACHVVAGVGINVRMPEALLGSISDWPAGAVDLYRLTGGRPPTRTELAARLVRALGRLFASYADTGFGPYRDSWRRADYLRGKQVSLHAAGSELQGTAAGIGDDGALLVELASGAQHRAISGDVSVRTMA